MRYCYTPYDNDFHKQQSVAAPFNLEHSNPNGFLSATDDLSVVVFPIPGTVQSKATTMG